MGLEKYTPFLIGCEFELYSQEADGTVTYYENGILVAILPESAEGACLLGFDTKSAKGYFSRFYLPYDRVKPILRPMLAFDEDAQAVCLSECMSEGELNGLHRDITLLARKMAWLLRNSYDVFDLIGKGLAVEKQTKK